MICWRCYGLAFGSRYCSSPIYCNGTGTVVPSFLSPQFRLFSLIRIRAGSTFLYIKRGTSIIWNQAIKKYFPNPQMSLKL
jgi:hypothetical protein